MEKLSKKIRHKEKSNVNVYSEKYNNHNYKLSERAQQQNGRDRGI